MNPVYVPEVPSATGTKKTPQSNKDSGAKSSQTGGATAPSDAGESNESSSESSSEGGGAAGNPGSGGDGGSGQSSPGNGSKGDANQAGNQQPGASQQGQQARAETAADDSSSPLVPILIAIAVLAAISIGVILYRQRRQRPGTSVSPKAS